MFLHALTFAGSRGSNLNTRPLGRVFKHLPVVPASVNEMKQTCGIIILAYLSDSNHRSTESTAKTLKYHLTLVFSIQNGVSVKLLNIITSSQRLKTSTY